MWNDQEEKDKEWRDRELHHQDPEDNGEEGQRRGLEEIR